MREYFETTIPIFDAIGSDGGSAEPEVAETTAKDAGASRFLQRFKPGFVALWPGFMEDRLKEINARLFRHADNDIRGIIKDLRLIFRENMRAFVAKKRIAQATTTFLTAFVVLAYLCLLEAGWWQHAHWLQVGIWQFPVDGRLIWGFVALLVVPLVVYWIFHLWNNSISEYYDTALDRSGVEVSERIKDRMNDLEKLYTRYNSKLTKLVREGEKVTQAALVDQREHVQHVADNAKFWTQMLIWLPKRVEHIEEYIRYEMQTAQLNQMRNDFVGWLIALAIFLASTIVSFVVILSLLVFTHQNLMAATGIWLVFAGLTTYAAILAWLSYTYSGWRSEEDVLRKRFNTTPWTTYSKFKLHEVLGDWSRDVMGWINRLLETLGR